MGIQDNYIRYAKKHHIPFAVNMVKASFERMEKFITSTNFIAYDNSVMMPRKYIKQMDTIDMTDIPEVKGSNDETGTCIPTMPNSAFIERAKEDWCIIIPPLKTGVVRPNRNRYLLFDVDEISMEHQAFSVTIHDYCMNTICGSTWSLQHVIHGGVYVVDGEIRTVVSDSCSLTEIYGKIINDFGTSKDDIDYYHEVFKPNMSQIETEEDSKRLLNCFVSLVGYVNVRLMHNKPKTSRTRTNKTISVVVGDAKPKKQILRAYGDIRIKSEKIVRPSTYDNVRKYHVAAWNTRGHVRHYKSGKVVYVQPSVHHRKCMDKTNAPQTLIRVK